MTVVLLVFCAIRPCFLVEIFQISGGDFYFHLQTIRQRLQLQRISGTFRNFYMTARRDMSEGSELFVCEFWVTINFSEVYLFCSVQTKCVAYSMIQSVREE